MNLSPESHRLMLAALRPCGRMSAARWLDHTIERNAGDDEFIDRVTQRGDVVRVVDVPRGAAPPEPICESGCARCRCSHKIKSYPETAASP